MTDLYILDENHIPIPTDDSIEWGMWLERENRIVKKTEVLEICEVSTVFLGIDHNFSMEGPPILFETMLFFNEFCKDIPEELEHYQIRYTTWDEAMIGHEQSIAYVRELFDTLRGEK